MTAAPTLDPDPEANATIHAALSPCNYTSPPDPLALGLADGDLVALERRAAFHLELCAKLQRVADARSHAERALPASRKRKASASFPDQNTSDGEARKSSWLCRGPSPSACSDPLRHEDSSAGNCKRRRGAYGKDNEGDVRRLRSATLPESPRKRQHGRILATLKGKLRQHSTQEALQASEEVEHRNTVIAQRGHAVELPPPGSTQLAAKKSTVESLHLTPLTASCAYAFHQLPLFLDQCHQQPFVSSEDEGEGWSWWAALPPTPPPDVT